MLNLLYNVIDSCILCNNFTAHLTTGLNFMDLDHIFLNPILNDIYIDKYSKEYSLFLYKAFNKYNKYHPILNDLRFFVKTQNIPKYMNAFIDYLINRPSFTNKTKSNIEFLQKYLLYNKDHFSGLVLFDLQDYKYLTVNRFFDIWLNNSFFILKDLGNYVYYAPFDARMFWYNLVFHNNVYYTYYTYYESNMLVFKDNYWNDFKLYLMVLDFKRYLEYLYLSKL